MSATTDAASDASGPALASPESVGASPPAVVAAPDTDAVMTVAPAVAVDTKTAAAESSAAGGHSNKRSRADTEPVSIAGAAGSSDAAAVSDSRPPKPSKRRRRDTAPTDSNIDVCLGCGLLGELVMCDTCVMAYHAKCVGLSVIPDGVWRCPICTGAKSHDQFRQSRQVVSEALMRYRTKKAKAEAAAAAAAAAKAGAAAGATNVSPPLQLKDLTLHSRLVLHCVAQAAGRAPRLAVVEAVKSCSERECLRRKNCQSRQILSHSSIDPPLAVPLR